MFRDPTFPLAPTALEASIRERQDSTVVMVDGIVAGFANFYGRTSGESCSIGNVIVDPVQRGKGVAKFLIETMVNIAIDKYGARSTKLVCFNHNIAGLLLYTKLGFKPFEIEERATPDGKRVAAIRMAVSTEDWKASRIIP